MDITRTRAGVAATIDHTLLAPEATTEAVAALCADAARMAVAAVCVNATRVPLPVALPGGMRTAAVVGFPSGAHPLEVKLAETRTVVGSGATEVDVVIDLANAMERRWGLVTTELAAVCSAAGSGVLVKAILETALLGPDRIADACRAAVAAGVGMVKTSTGFHPAGGATPEAVEVMAEVVGPGVGVKASGGIRTAEAALRMLDAGATRLGCSATAVILEGIPD